MTQVVDAVRGMTVNGVLDAELVTIRSTGSWAREFSVPYAYVFIVNLGVATMTITNDPSRGGSPPTVGTGVQLLEPGASIGANLAGRSLTIYGNPGDQANVEVLTQPHTPFYSAQGGNG